MADLYDLPRYFFLIRKYSQYASNFILTYDTALKKFVQYLKRFKRLGVKYGHGFGAENSNRNLLDFIDALYGNCFDTCHLTFVYVFLLWNYPISWLNKRQTTITTFTA